MSLRRFSFKYIDVPEVREMLHLQYQKDKVSFLAWWGRRLRHEADRPTEKEFRVWWLTLGPIGFTSTESSRRYKEELWRIIHG